MASWLDMIRAGLLLSSLGLISPAALSGVLPLAQIQTGLAIEYAKIGSLSHALAAANAALTVDPHYVEGWLARAWVYTLLKQKVEAEKNFQRALTLAPTHPEANNNYGAFLCECGEPGQAIPYFYRALADPLYSTPHMAWANIGRCRLQMGETAAAREALLTSLSLLKDYAPALKALASLYLEQCEVNLSVHYFERLYRQLDPRTLVPNDLLLGIRIARLAKNRAREQELAADLINLYPSSDLTQQLSSGS